MSESFLNGRVVLHAGDCLDVTEMFVDNSFDACVTDPPYHLTSIVKRFGANNAAPAKSNGATGVYARASSGFMGQQWDGGDVAFRPETWAKVLRVLKPGAHLVSFAAPKNAHRLTCAIEDAGFEIRDVIMWLYGQGFPKSHDAGNGWGTALKPAYEPIILARKPLIGTVAENVMQHGTGGINIDGCRVEGSWERNSTTRCDIRGDPQIAHALGRWPANIAHDGSDDVVTYFPETGPSSGGCGEASQRSALGGVVYGEYSHSTLGQNAGGLGDSGSAARLFYTAKADADDRLGSKHPTVKPIDLMQWLVRLVTPPKGTILDPFAGTGTTGEAAYREGFNAVLIEREAKYQEDIRRRMALVLSGPSTRSSESIKARGLVEDAGPLFAIKRL